MNQNKKEIIKKEIILSNEIPSNLQQQISQSVPNEDNNNIQSDLLIINPEEIPNKNNIYYQKELYINNKNRKNENPSNIKKQIYTKVRSDSHKQPFQKAQISSYIYRTEKPVPNINNNNLAKDYIRYNTNTKYFIKNPVKEKSKNVLNKNHSQNQLIINVNKNRNNKNLRIIDSIINNTVINDTENNYIFNNNIDEEIPNINNTQYNFRPGINLNLINNTDNSDNIYNLDTNSNMNMNINKGGNINLNPIKQQYIAFNRRINTNSKNYQPSPRESHISYIYDYSQENNKDSYYVESPNVLKHMTVYPLRPKIKKRNKTEFITFNKKSPRKNNDKLKKAIEDSRLKFEKIREIEKNVKNYFNANGLNLENRELYDQSATMIQSAFRAYYSRMKLFKELNSFVNIGFMIEVLKKIFIPRKSDYWENFLKGILKYLSYINNLNINNANSAALLNVNNDKSVFPDEKPTKKIPNSYRKKKNKKFKNQKLLMPQLCVSFDLINNNNDNNEINDDNNINININNDNKKDLEEKLNKLLLENEELKKSNQNLRNQYENYILNQENNNFQNISNNNNIVKDTQKSVELNLDEEINLPLAFSFKENKTQLLKKSKLKYLIANKISKTREFLYKNFLKFYYNAKFLKNTEKKPMIYTKNKIKSSFNNNINNSNISNGNISNGNEYSFREKKDEKLNKKKLKKLRNLCINLDKKRKNLLKNKFIIFYYKGLVQEIKEKKQNIDNKNEENENNINENENIENINDDKVEDE